MHYCSVVLNVGGRGLLRQLDLIVNDMGGRVGLMSRG